MFAYPFISIPEDDIINGPDSFPDINLDKPWLYKGWRIWRWTGWKGYWARRNPHHGSDMTPLCKECGRVIELWDLVYYSPCLDGVWHAECKPEYHGEIAGQWLAMDRVPSSDSDWKTVIYLYSSAPGGEGIYTRGASFDLGVVNPLTYYTDLETLEEAKQNALERLHTLIDNFYVQEYPDANL